MIDERISPDTIQRKAPTKLVPFPAGPQAVPPKAHKDRSRKYWLIAGLSSLLVAAIAATTWWAVGERGTVHYVT
ncbi:MAG: hypothetical protein ACXWKP_26800, partial [Bradyrhizobium sp.]